MSAKLIPVPCKTQWHMYNAEFYAILKCNANIEEEILTDIKKC